ncbi:MFS transporter [Raoultibacter phocaeensis]|uniref:MFS transporter n=1 Tax=Raoultibacter phocaeensis TaxID=2479841 RepID=UPI00111A821E|nr:MFS transporter [Raoultibacter phocaeensis]
MLVAIVIVLVGIAIALGQFKVPSIMPAIMDEFSMDVGSASWLMSIFTFAGIFLALPTGALARRFGPKNMMLAAVAVIAVGTVVGAFATSGSMLIVSRAIEGVALVFCGVAAPLAIQRYIAPDKIGFAMGVWALWFSLGSFFGGVVTPALFETLGFRGVWFFMAGVAVAAGLALFFLVRPTTGTFFEAVAQASSLKGSTDKPDYRILAKPNVLLVLGSFLMFNMVLLSMLSFSPTFLQSQGMDASQAGFASTLPMLIAIVSSPAFGMLADKTGKVRLLSVVAMLAMGPCACALLTTTGPIMWIAAVVMGLVGLGAPTMFLTLYPRAVGNEAVMPVAMGLLILVQSLGQFLGTALMPLVLSAGWLAMGLTVMVLGFIGAALLAFVKTDARAGGHDNL